MLKTKTGAFFGCMMGWGDGEEGGRDWDCFNKKWIQNASDISKKWSTSESDVS